MERQPSFVCRSSTQIVTTCYLGAATTNKSEHSGRPKSDATNSTAKSIPNTMKTTKPILTVLFVLLTAQIASAYYCPSTGRWLSRDPIGEPGFQVQQMAAQIPAVTSDRWINRDPIGEQGKKVDTATAFLNALGIKSRLSKPNINSNPDANQNTVNLYVFVGNNPLIAVDGFGLFGLPNACRH